MNAVFPERPLPFRWVVAVILTGLTAPLLSPVYWGWGFIAFEGAAGVADLMGGLVSGALVAYTFAWPAVVAGISLFAGLIFWKFDSWVARAWWQWFILGAALASIAVSFVLGLFGGEDGLFAILPAIGACAPAGGLAALVFRRVLLGNTPQPDDAAVNSVGGKAKSDV